MAVVNKDITTNNKIFDFGVKPILKLLPKKSKIMVQFIALGTNNLQNAEVFYNNVLKPLNYRPMERGRTHLGYAKQNDDLAPILYVGNPFDGQPANPGNGVMVAFSCPSTNIVNKCHELLIINGGAN